MKIIEVEITDDEYATLSAIAHAAGTTATAVAQGATKERIREFGRPIVRQIVDRYARNLATREIAADLGVPNNVVRDTLTRLHLPAHRKPRPADPRPVSPRSRRIAS
jgi:hypothetical protein